MMISAFVEGELGHLLNAQAKAVETGQVRLVCSAIS